jgi:hypothetical protein
MIEPTVAVGSYGKVSGTLGCSRGENVMSMCGAHVQHIPEILSKKNGLEIS